jgi:3D (Asp-Asp-Asp) domain-containing protein
MNKLLNLVVVMVIVLIVINVSREVFRYEGQNIDSGQNISQDIAVDVMPSLTQNPLSSPTIQKVPTTVVKNDNLQMFYITFYGWSDNDPPGDGIAYPKSKFSNSIHEKAGGMGSYENPITFASDPAKISVGTRIYIPYLKKYAVMEDLCLSCVDNWRTNGQGHIDVWMESDGSFPNQLFSCERKWTRQRMAVEIGPPPGKLVDTTPFFDKVSGICY